MEEPLPPPPFRPESSSGGNFKGKTGGWPHGWRVSSPAPRAAWALALSSDIPSAAPAAPWGEGTEGSAVSLGVASSPAMPRSAVTSPFSEQPGQQDPEGLRAQGRRSPLPPAGRLSLVPESRFTAHTNPCLPKESSARDLPPPQVSPLTRASLPTPASPSLGRGGGRSGPVATGTGAHSLGPGVLRKVEWAHGSRRCKQTQRTCARTTSLPSKARDANDLIMIQITSAAGRRKDSFS